MKHENPDPIALLRAIADAHLATIRDDKSHEQGMAQLAQLQKALVDAGDFIATLDGLEHAQGDGAPSHAQVNADILAACALIDRAPHANGTADERYAGGRAVFDALKLLNGDAYALNGALSALRPKLYRAERDLEFMRSISRGTLTRRSMYLRHDVGTATEGGVEYELTFNLGNGQPLICNKDTGLTWTIDWESLLALARERGLDDHDVTDEDLDDKKVEAEQPDIQTAPEVKP